MLITTKNTISIVALGLLSAMIIGTVLTTQSASAIGPKQERGAWEFAPGILNRDDDDTQNAAELSPGHQEGRLPGGGCNTPNFAPGHLFRQQETD